MAAEGIGGATKTAFQVFLTLLWMASGGVLGVSIWLLVDDIVSTGMRAEFGLGWFYIPVHLLISSAVFGVIGGILGFIGAKKGNRLLLLIFCGVLVLVATLSFTAGGLSYTYRDELMRGPRVSDRVGNSLIDALAGDQLDNRPVELQAAVKRAQERFLCCGLTFRDNWDDYCADETCRNINLEPCSAYAPCQQTFNRIVIQYGLYVFAVAFTHGGLQFLGLLLVVQIVRRLGSSKKKEKRGQSAEMEKMEPTSS